MKVAVTLETGEHITGELYAVEIVHAYSDAILHAQVAEIEALTFENVGMVTTSTTFYPNAEADR